MGTFLLGLISALVGINDAGNLHQSDSRDMYDLVLATTAELLPTPLKDYQSTHLNPIRSSSVTPQKPTPGDPKQFVPADHYLKLDIAAKGADAAARRKSALSFPRDHKSARSFFDQHNEKDGGELPWNLDEQVRQLHLAFESGTREATIAHWGAIIHFATDAAMPFNATYDLSGKSTSESKWCASGSAATDSICNLRDRVQRTLLTRNISRLTYEVRVSPDRVKQIDDPIQSAFDVLLDSHEVMLRIVEADRRILADLRISDVEHFQTSADAYYSHLANDCIPLIEERLESAALLSANLIQTAWIRAGRPNLEEKPPVSADKTTGASPSKTDPNQPGQPSSTEKPYAASVNSMVFHRVGCSHLKRVKTENVVYFASLIEAQGTGRTGCKTCNP